jgi:Skp family chaperone for outer membrane proteins
MRQLELGLLQDEVALLRQQVGDALKNKVQYETNPSRQDPRTGDDIQRAYEIARRLYLDQARELASKRRRVGLAGEPPKGEAEASTKAAPGAEGGRDEPATRSGPHTSATMIGSIDMDAVFKRYTKIRRYQETHKAALDAARGRIAKLQADAASSVELMQKLVPDSPEYRAARDQVATLKGRIESERAVAEGELSRLQARESAWLLEEIQRVIAEVARVKGMDFVVKVEAGLRADANPDEVFTAMKRSVLYANPRNDITEEVIGELNRRFVAAGDEPRR